MGKTSTISWTDATWNVAVGCTKVDEDCKYCYMYRESLLGSRYNPKEVRQTKTVFNLPLRLKDPRRIFTSSLTDFFHPEIDSFRLEAFDIIRRCPQHTFQILTKRPERVEEALRQALYEAQNVNPWLFEWLYKWLYGMAPENVWLGTSVGSNESRHRIEQLVTLPAAVRFVSFEPLHGEVDLNFDICTLIQIHWAIIGGESGNEQGQYRYRPCQLEWIENLVAQCDEWQIPVFVKQMGTYLAKQMGLKDRHGADPAEWPAHLQLQQFPILK